MRVIHQFSNLQTSNLHWLNSTNIVLLPKKDGAEEIGDFRSFSLIHAIAKIIAKMLSVRLAPFMNNLVSNAQSAFIKKASMTTSCTSETLHDDCIETRPHPCFSSWTFGRPSTWCDGNISWTCFVAWAFRTAFGIGLLPFSTPHRHAFFSTVLPGPRSSMVVDLGRETLSLSPALRHRNRHAAADSRCRDGPPPPTQASREGIACSDLPLC